MAGLGGGWDVIFNRIPELAAVADKAISQIVRKAAFDCEARAKTLAPVQTGFLKSSIYVELHDGGGDYDQAASRASNKSTDAEMLPEVDKPLSSHEAYVAVGASYGIYVEMGTVHAPAQPYLLPAAEITMPAMMAAFEKLELALTLGGIKVTGVGGELGTSGGGEE